jgi:hypothetical protein
MPEGHDKLPEYIKDLSNQQKRDLIDLFERTSVMEYELQKMLDR